MSSDSQSTEKILKDLFDTAFKCGYERAIEDMQKELQGAIETLELITNQKGGMQ